MNVVDRLNRATEIAPVPASRDAGTDEWIRHHAAQALAAWATFHDLTAAPEHDDATGAIIGLLSGLGVAHTNAALAMAYPGEGGGVLWDYTPEAGALNGEWEEWLAATLDRLGINPADVDDRFRADDFRSPRLEGNHG